MALTKDDLDKIAALLHPLDEQNRALQTHIDAGFSRVFELIDGLHRQLAERDAEQLAVRDEVAELQSRVKKLAVANG